jgi:hypothetical protein
MNDNENRRERQKRKQATNSQRERQTWRCSTPYSGDVPHSLLYSLLCTNLEMLHGPGGCRAVGGGG